MYRFTIEPAFDAVLYLFSQCDAALINVDCGSGGATGDVVSAPAGVSTSLRFVPAAAGEYVLAVDSAASEDAGAFSLEVEEVPEPEHAACVNAKPLALHEGQANVTESTLGAFNEHGEELTCGLGATMDGPQLYYSVELSAGTWYAFELESEFSSALYVANSKAECVPANLQADCSGITGTAVGIVPAGGSGRGAFFPPTTGTYLVAVEGTGPEQRGSFTLGISTFQPPGNMVCSAAAEQPIGSAGVSGDTSSFVNERGAQLTCGTGQALIAPQAYYSVALDAQPYRFLLKPTFPAVLGVGQSCLTIPVDCSSGGISGDAVEVPAGAVGQLRFTPPAPGSYLVLVDGTSASAAGSFELAVEPDLVPAHGSCGSPRALSLTSNPTVELGDTGPLRNDLTGVSCGHPAGPWSGPQAYYQVALAPGTYRVVVEPEPGFDPALYALPGGTKCAPAAVDVACTGMASDLIGAGLEESVTLTIAQEQEIVLVVDSWSPSEVGTYSLSISWN
jgi:hypothetical protein